MGPQGATRLLSLVPSPAAALLAARWLVSGGQVCLTPQRAGETGVGATGEGVGGSRNWEDLRWKPLCSSGQDSDFTPWGAEA